MIKVRELEDQVHGPVFSADDGNVAYSGTFEVQFHEVLEEVQIRRPDLIPVIVDVPSQARIVALVSHLGEDQILKHSVRELVKEILMP